MKKIDPTVIKETKYIACWTVILSAVMQAVFLIIGKWNLNVLFGNLYGAGFALLNFFLIGITVQIALEKEDEKDAKSVMKLSQSSRTLLLFVVAALGVYLPCFNTWTVLIPLFFPRIAIAFRSLFKDKQDGGEKN